MQDLRTKDPKFKLQKFKLSAFLHPFKSENIGTSKKTRKKKDCQNQQRSQKSSIPATRVNATNISVGRARNNGTHSGRSIKNLSQITCYNYDMKGYYVDKCLEPKKRLMKKLVTVSTTYMSTTETSKKPVIL